MSIYRLRKGKLVRRRQKRPERWKVIQGYPRYKISNKGRIKGYHNKVLAIGPHNTVVIGRGRVRTRRSVTKLLRAHWHIPGSLTPDKVIELKGRIQVLQNSSSGDPLVVARGTWVKLAKEYGISRVMLWYIRAGKRWKGIK